LLQSAVLLRLLRRLVLYGNEEKLFSLLVFLNFVIIFIDEKFYVCCYLINIIKEQE